MDQKKSPDKDKGGLQPEYRTYKRQKCFIAHSEQATWSEDLLEACQDILSQPEFDLEPDYARQHFNPDVPLRQKVLELIANARYGIYDLSSWQDEQGEWHTPHNIFIELGMAIALNRPTLLLRHANNRELTLPECLQSMSGQILPFSGSYTLKKELAKRLPQWINTPPEQDWWNRYCTFGGQLCEYRQAHPKAKQWGEQELYCHISDGPDLDRSDFRDVVEDVLDRFRDVTFNYLDTLPLADGYQFLPCSHCQTVRSSPFAIYRITPHTSAETFIAIGMSIALEQQFEYTIPKILLAEDKQNIPSLLEGYEVIVAKSDRQRKKQLRRFLPKVMRNARSTVLRPRSLPFVDIPARIDRLSSDLKKIKPKDMRWTNLNGNWKIENDEYLHSRHSSHDLIDGDYSIDFRCKLQVYQHSEPIRDGIIETKIKLYDKLADNSGRIVFRYIDSENYLFAGIGGYGRKFVIGRRTPSMWSALEWVGDDTELILGKWYTVRVLFDGHRIELLVDGTLVLTANEVDLLEPGLFGIETWQGTRVGFKDIGFCKLNHL